MESKKDDLAELKNELARVDQEAQHVTSVNILFLDISSSCTGYSIMSLDFNTKKGQILKAGAVWLNPDWPHAQKYDYMYSVITNYFDIIEKIDHIVVEQYSVNPSRMMGVNVVSEMQGAIKAAAWNTGTKVTSILPQTWRSQLGIKPIVTTNSKGKKERDYKEPTKQAVLQQFSVPATTISNITRKERTTPSDTFDAIAIALGWSKKYGFKIVDSSKCEYNTHIGTLDYSLS